MESFASTAGLIRRSKRLSNGNHTEERLALPVLINAHVQDQSPFFRRLPAEVRRLIYASIFPTQVIQIMHDHTQRASRPDLSRALVAAAIPCETEMDGTRCCVDPWVCCMAHCTTLQSGVLNGGLHNRRCRCKPPLIMGSLVRGCRLFYAEIVPLLYGNKTFIFSDTDFFRQFCDELVTNKQFIPSPISFVQDVRFAWNFLVPGNIVSAMLTGLAILAEKAGSLKILEVPLSFVLDDHTRPMLLSKESLRRLGSFRGLEKFDLPLEKPGAPFKESVPKRKAVIEEVLRELVYQPQGSGAMTGLQFDKHFRSRYSALMVN